MSQSKPDLRIVPASESDIPAVLELIRALAEYENLSEECVATEAKLRETLFGPKPSAEALLAYSEGECAGYAVYFATYSTFLAQPGLFLEDIFVKPHLRGKGIGGALLKCVAGIAVQRGCSRMEWEVLDWNTPSIAFYKKLGAEPMDDWTKYALTGDTLKRVASLKD